MHSHTRPDLLLLAVLLVVLGLGMSDDMIYIRLPVSHYLVNVAVIGMTARR